MESLEKLLLKFSLSGVNQNILVDIFINKKTTDILSLKFEDIKDFLGKEFEKIKNVNDSKINKLYDKLKNEDVKIVCLGHKDYPQNLTQIPNPPPILYIKGSINDRDINSVAIIGTRKPTEYGKTVAMEFAKKLAEYEITVVSGLAIGIDAAAHIGAIEKGGRTIGVIGCGIDIVYPQINRRLFDLVKESGAIISEFPPGTKPYSFNFPLRNRIISGLSKAIIAVQAGLKSGVFSTVKWALEFGREIFAVPGNINVPQSEGTNKLLKMGANVITEINDVLSLFGIEEKKMEEEIDLPEDEKKIFDILSDEPLSLENISGILGLSIQNAAASLLLLELKGYVRDVGGKKYVKMKL